MVFIGPGRGRSHRRSMAIRKPTQPLPSRPSLHSMPPPQRGGVMRVARGIVKGLALAVGGLLTFIALMATTGLVVQSGWIRAIVAALVMLATPAVIVDRLLPENVDARAKGLPTDVFALVWLGVALLYVVVLYDWTRPALVTEADRLGHAGYGRMAMLARFVAAVAPSAEPSPELARHAKPKPPAPARSSSPRNPEAKAAEEPAPPASAPAASSQSEPEEQPEERDAATLFEELAPAVVTVQVGDDQHVSGGGTGFLIDKRGTIATNQHVIADATRVRVTFMQGAAFNEPELLSEDAAVDLALLRVPLSEPDVGEPVTVAPLELGDSDGIAVGQPALSIGNPLGLDHTLTDGLISARRLYEGRQWIQTTVPISPGNSGGPLFNYRGQVIGVTTASVGGSFSRAQNLNLAVPVNILKRLLKDEYPAKRRFGDGKRSAHW